MKKLKLNSKHMKKLLLIIPFILIGCVSPEQQSRNLQIMQGIANQQEAERRENQAIYQQDLENRQRQQMIELQKRQLKDQSGPRTYSVTDQNGNTRTYTVKPDPYKLR